MRQTSGLLPALGRSLDGALPEPGDTDLSIPAALIPVLEASFPQQAAQNLAGGSSFDIEYLESFSVDWNIDRAAGGGAQTTRMGYLMPGLWDVTVFATLGVPILGNSFVLYYNFMDYPDLNGLQTVNILNFFGNGGSIQFYSLERHFRVLIPKQRVYRIEAIVNNTAGASTFAVRLFTHFRRLA